MKDNERLSVAISSLKMLKAIEKGSRLKCASSRE